MWIQPSTRKELQDFGGRAPYISHDNGVLWDKIPIVLVISRRSMWEPYGQEICSNYLYETDEMAATYPKELQAANGGALR